MIVQLRASKITIDTPKYDAMPWVQVIVQKVLRNDDYSINNVITRWEQFSIPLSDVLSKTYPVPTKADDHITGGELFNSIYTLVVMAMQERYGGTVNDKQDLIL